MLKRRIHFDLRLTVKGFLYQCLLAFCLSGLLCYTSPSDARVTTINEPENWDDLSFELLTVGLGDRIEARYGHTFIRVHNRKTGKDHNINWGMFDFSDPMLPLNFFLGKLRYWVTDEGFGSMIRRYKYFEKRPVYADQLNLTSLQKKNLLTRINQNLRPENKYFWYQYFYQNCSTFPRDYLNEVLGNKLKDRFESEDANIDFRHYVRENLNRPPPISFFLDIVMNGRLETRLSKWVEMFYPPKLRDHLMDFPAYDDQGQEIPGKKLLDKGTVLVDLPNAPADSWTVHPWFLAIGTGLSVLLLLCLNLFVKGRSRRIYPAAICAGLTGLVWGLFSGVLGTVMSVSWMVSEHLDLLHNANLWVFWPTDFILIFSPLMLSGLRSGREPSLSGRRIKSGLKAYLWLHIFTMATWYLLCLSGIIIQNTSNVMIWVAPSGLLFYLSLLYADHIGQKLKTRSAQ